MMDILGLPKRMFQHFEQMTHVEKGQATEATTTKTLTVDFSQTPMSERIAHLANEFDVKSLEVKDLIPLQQAMKEAQLIQPHQVRAQGLLTQLAYQHQQTGPMDVESALENHLSQLREKPAVLADYKEGQHVLNMVRNLASARADSMHAA